jgi:hypothetical protein
MADIIVNNKYIKVTNTDNSIAVADYFVAARIETMQTINAGEIITDIPVTRLPLLPEVGQSVIKDKLYNYGGITVHCIQSHIRTIYPPEQTPNLFAVYRPNSDTLDWIINEKVTVGWKRVYNGNTYIVLQAHMTQTTWNPVITLGTLWNVVATSSAWTVGVAYKVNDIVTYQTKTYKCLQAHTSQAGWTPVAVPALWQLQ